MALTSTKNSCALLARSDSAKERKVEENRGRRNTCENAVHTRLPLYHFLLNGGQ